MAFTNAVPVYEQINVLVSQYHYNGGGVAIGDLNNDGLQDVFFVQNFGPDHLYLNQGDFEFLEVAKEAGVVGTMSWETGVTLVDINSDGWTDIYLSRSGLAPGTPTSNLLYINEGTKDGSSIPHFSEKAAAYGLRDISHSTDAAFFDYDRDGDLDVFVLNHNVKRITQYNFDEGEALRDIEVGDILFRNDGVPVSEGGEGKGFTDISAAAGIIGKSISYGLGLMVGDLNQDAWPDIYVCNDFGERDYLYMNNGDGTFREELTQTLDHIPYYSMGGDIADFNNDGWLDIMTLDMTAQDNFGQKANMNAMDPGKFWFLVDQGMHYQYMVNCLQMNTGSRALGSQKIGFSEISYMSGLAYTDWSWAPLFADFDNDGLQDVFITNGYRVNISNKDFVHWYQEREKKLQQTPLPQRNRAQELQEALSKLSAEQTANYMFKNTGDLRFEDVGADWGFSQPSFSNGVAYGDLDNDGDLDMVVNNLDHEAFVYKNTQSDAQYLRIDLQGPPHNNWGIGSKVWVETDGGTQYRELYVSRGYLSSVEPIVHVGLGSHTDIKRLTVEWPDGSRQTLRNVKPNQTLRLVYSKSDPLETENTPPSTRFIDVSSAWDLHVQHKENVYDDYEKEVLLPYKMSQLGPALAIGDINQDGLEDFFVGGAKGHAGRIFMQSKAKKFVENNPQTFTKDSHCEDIAAHFFDADGDGDLDLYVVSGGNEVEENRPELQDRLYMNEGLGEFSRAKDLPSMLTSGGCVASGDYDQDGDLDLFVGGRMVPGKYPYAPRSYLLENNQGKFTDVTASVAPSLLHAGLVTSALWTDYDSDGRLDLLLVGEWMPLTFLHNEPGGLSPLTPVIEKRETGEVKQLPSNATSGWWYSLSQADIDRDGDMDYVAGNLGLNYKYQATETYPFEIYAHDFDANGTSDIVLGYYNERELYPLRGKQCSSEQIPSINQKFESYNEFAQASLLDIYGDMGMDKALHYKAHSFASVVLENQGEGRFTIRELPSHAQIAPIFGSVINDVDGDGNIDIVIAGNLYASEVETPRADAGKGLFLQGNGTWDFAPVASHDSGLFLDGDVKQLKAIDLGKSGMGFLVARNNGKLALWRLGDK